MASGTVTQTTEFCNIKKGFVFAKRGKVAIFAAWRVDRLV